ncbi:hypothetical protein AXF13_07175 [Desulfovibrio fairfieldensis]|uniref:Uncharacterized protein n=1 Tax=Desulfovibrio fairfieldensis TaxID=44742 RepID=A0A109W471_9BACT|nr:hypothetical protein AXF13_07175 [Desulfovibrio fairfieldensis]
MRCNFIHNIAEKLHRHKLTIHSVFKGSGVSVAHRAVKITNGRKFHIDQQRPFSETAFFHPSQPLLPIGPVGGFPAMGASPFKLSLSGGSLKTIIPFVHVIRHILSLYSGLLS